MGSGFLCWLVSRSGRFLLGFSKFEMHLKSAAELLGVCSISEQLMSPSVHRLGSAATSFIRLVSHQAGGSNARLALGSPGLGSEVGDVLGFSGEWAQISFLCQCLA